MAFGRADRPGPRDVLQGTQAELTIDFPDLGIADVVAQVKGLDGFIQGLDLFDELVQETQRQAGAFCQKRFEHRGRDLADRAGG
jgi:hypothetical protein